MKKNSNIEIPSEVEKIETSQQDIIDIDLSATAKKRIRINGDDNCILYLNTSDLLIMDRFRQIYPKLRQLATEASEKLTDSDKDMDKVASVLKDIDVKMRKYIDEIFQADVSEKCAPFGSMYDPLNGEFRFEHILSVIFSLYAKNINKEFSIMSSKIKRHTDKYTG